MTRYFALVFQKLGWLHFDFLVYRKPLLPAKEIDDRGQMVIVRSGAVEKWACMSCPGGCGKIISLSLNPNQSPRWTVKIDFWQRPSLHPSVHQQNECGCHFWVKQGQVRWCKNGTPNQCHSYPFKKNRTIEGTCNE